MAHINYQCLRGKVHAFAPAQPPTNPHLWVILEADNRLWFATINVRSDKGQYGDPEGKSFLYYLIDGDFRHPIIPSILARPAGMSAVARDYASGALDYQRGNLFDPRAMRVLPMDGDGGLEPRLSAILQIARDKGDEVFFYGNAFAKDNPHQTDAAFGYTPDTPFGIDNIHMAQGDPRAVDARIHENGVWHDGGLFVWDASASRMTAAFLAFQTQAWHTNDNGDLLYGATGCEAPSYDFSAANGAGAPLPLPTRAAELTSAHRAPDGPSTVVIANMTSAPIDLTGWTILCDAAVAVPAPAGPLAPGQPLIAPLPAGALNDSGGILTLINAAGLRVDGVAHFGGDPAKGWSASFG